MNPGAAPALAVSLALLALAGCRSSRAPLVRDTGAPGHSASTLPVASATPPPEAEADADAAPELTPLVTSRMLEPLVVEGFRDAVVAVPYGARERRPIVVALHGNYDRPEWQCEVWREAFETHPFILCPRGIPRDDAPRSEDRYTYGALETTSKEIDAGLTALRARFADYVADGGVVFVGFSLGAILGRVMVMRSPERFSRVVLVEGGYETWGAGQAKALADRRGRVLLACGQHACGSAASRTARLLNGHGLPARAAFGGNIGHTYDGKVAKAVRAELPWLLDGDPRWPDYTVTEAP